MDNRVWVQKSNLPVLDALMGKYLGFDSASGMILVAEIHKDGE